MACSLLACSLKKQKKTPQQLKMTKPHAVVRSASFVVTMGLSMSLKSKTSRQKFQEKFRPTTHQPLSLLGRRWPSSSTPFTGLVRLRQIVVRIVTENTDRVLALVYIIRGKDATLITSQRRFILTKGQLQVFNAMDELNVGDNVFDKSSSRY